ncbi:hypothetical protein AB4456_23835 [Vibrio splendidus]
MTKKPAPPAPKPRPTPPGIDNVRSQDDKAPSFTNPANKDKK